MRGFQPAKKAKHFAGGGPVRGPGTGTSDEVPDEVPEGTYIMPADSTQAMGEQQLEAMGGAPRGFDPGRAGKPVPVQLSNGEFKMPPEQVHAVGVQALDQMKDATHQPARGFVPGRGARLPAGALESQEPRMFFANGGAVKRGFQPRRHFAKGGVVDDENQRTNSFGDAAAAHTNPGVTQPASVANTPATREPTPATTVPPATVPAAAQASPPASSPAPAPIFGSGNSFGDAAAVQSGAVRQARGFQPATASAPAPASGGGMTEEPQRSAVGMTVEQAQREGLIGERIGYDPAHDQRLTGKGVAG